MEPWYKIVTPREEVREGRSFDPAEFAIALEQVVAGTAPEDYRDPAKFFARTHFTAALTDHLSVVLRRLAGETKNTAPVLTLITQFGGGKTHTLTALYHLVSNGVRSHTYSGVPDLLTKASLNVIPTARVALFIGNAWDPQPGRETPWTDIAWQLAGEEGVRLLGTAAATVPPGTQALDQVFAAAGAPVLILFDEVLNCLNRHRSLAESFHAFIQNLTVALTGTRHGVALISLPRSQVEMTDSDRAWQEKITKVVRRVAKDLIANDETEIAEVVRRRLFEDLGNDRIRQKVARAYGDWCFERRAQLPPEWTAVESAPTEARAREFLQERFEACYPFHPATLAVFQRKWQSLAQYQRTRGTLAMLAQWISTAGVDMYRNVRPEPLITLGSAPLEISSFRSVVLGQLGQDRLDGAIMADIAGPQSHARALDADTKGALYEIHRQAGTAIFFESTGGQADKVARLPELRFGLGRPGLDTTSIDNAAIALEHRGFYIRRVGTDGFKFHHQATLKKVVADRRASLDFDRDVRPAVEALVRSEFQKGGKLGLIDFPSDAADIPDTPRLTLVAADPTTPWEGSGAQRKQAFEWMKRRGATPRLYPAAIVWCFPKPGRDLFEKVETWLGWTRVRKEAAAGVLGQDFEPGELAEVDVNVRTSQSAARDEVWASYRYVVLFDLKGEGGLQVLDLGAGHASGSDTLKARVLGALKSYGLLNESVGAGYIERHWPPALKKSGAWPLSGVRQSFLDGSLTRLLDPDLILKTRIPDFVNTGDLGLASGRRVDGGFDRVRFEEDVAPDEVEFESDVFLLTKARAAALKAGPSTEPEPVAPPEPGPDSGPPPLVGPDEPGAELTRASEPVQLRVAGTVPPEIWNRLGTKVLPKLRSGSELRISVEFSFAVSAESAEAQMDDLRRALQELGLADSVRIERDRRIAYR